MTTLLLIRHGDNDMLGKRLAGRSKQVFLNEKGFQQAQSLAQALGGLPISAVYSSPLERTLQTARPLAIVRRLPVRVDIRLIEVDYGVFTGKRFADFLDDPVWILVHKQPDKVRFPGGETFFEVQARCVQALTDIAAQSTEDSIIACFTHGDIIRLALAHFLNMPLKDYQRLVFQPASISVVQLLPQQIRVHQVNTLPGLPVYIPAKPD